MNTRKYYRNYSYNALEGRWTPAVLATLIFVAVAGLVGAFSESDISIVFYAIEILVLMPLDMGLANAVRNYCKGSGEHPVNEEFKIGFGNWLHNVLAMFLTGLFTLLWTLLLIVPGIIKACSYALVPYIIVDDPHISAYDAIKKSSSMMKGHKMDYFLLCLSFIGWILLGIITFGIGLLWVTPYMLGAFGAYYEDVKAEYEAKTLAGGAGSSSTEGAAAEAGSDAAEGAAAGAEGAVAEGTAAEESSEA